MNGLLLAAIAGIMCSVPVPAYEVQFNPATMELSAMTAGGARELVKGIEYTASFAKGGLAFRTAGVAEVEPHGDGAWEISYALEGPAADEAQVRCTARLLSSRCLRLQWHIAYNGPQRAFNSWGCALRFAFARPPDEARTKALVRWVRPTGRHDWEVAGDAPYPDLERQLRAVRIGDIELAVLAHDYNPDWLYGGQLSRAAVHALNLPAKAPQQVTKTFEIVAAEPGVGDEVLIALASGEPLGIAVESGRLGNLFAPGEPLRVEAKICNVSRQPRQGRLVWRVWDYYGHCVARGSEAVQLAAGQQIRKRLVPAGLRARRGIYFVAVTLKWPGGRRMLRATVGVLPRRAPGAPDAASPFGLAAIIANPQTYPDQPDIETVLKLASRIGVRWIRGFGFPIKPEVKPQEVEQARRRLQLLRRYGILPHVQCGYAMPRSQQQAEVFARDFAASLRAYKFLSPYIEVGNEGNFSTKPADYVRLLLKPQFEVMRKVHPAGKVMCMGLGGVHRQWWEGFVKAGGLDYLDVVSVHPGHHPRAPEFWDGPQGPQVWEFWRHMLLVFNTLHRRGLDAQKQVWITEGYSPSSPTRTWLDLRTAADYLVREYCISLALGVRVIEWYQFQDGLWHSRRPKPDDGEYNYGMVYTDLTPKPQYIAYGVMTEQLGGARCVGRLDLGADDLYGIRFEDGAGRFIDVLWSYREKDECDLQWWPPEAFRGRHRRPAEPWEEQWRQTVAVELAARGGVRITDIMGNERVVHARGGKVRLELTGSPVYVRGLGSMTLRDIAPAGGEQL